MDDLLIRGVPANQQQFLLAHARSLRNQVVARIKAIKMPEIESFI
jgi:hypothetical protein